MGKKKQVYNCPESKVRPEIFGKKHDPRMVHPAAEFVCIDCNEAGNYEGKTLQALDQWRNCPQLTTESINNPNSPGEKFLYNNLMEQGDKKNEVRVSSTGLLSWLPEILLSWLGWGVTYKITPQWNPVMDVYTEWPQPDICMVCYKIIGETTVPPKGHLANVRRQQTGGSSWFGSGSSRPTPVARIPIRSDSQRQHYNRPSSPAPPRQSRPHWFPHYGYPNRQANQSRQSRDFDRSPIVRTSRSGNRGYGGPAPSW